MLGGLYAAVVVVDFVDGDVQCSRGGTGDEHLVAHGEGVGLDGELRHAELGEVFHTLADVLLALGGARAVVLVPLAQQLSLVVAVPEAAVEDGGESLVPSILFIFREGAVQHALDGLAVALYYGQDIFGTAGAAFNLEHPHT